MKKRPTITDVAREAGVSIASISYFLNGKGGVGAETRERIEQAIAKLGYIPDISARSLANRRSRLIGVVIPQLEEGSRLVFANPFYASILSSIEHEARDRGFHIIVSGVSADESYLELARRRNLEGIIIIGMYPDGFYEDLKRSEIPIVLVDSVCEDHDFDDVVIDDRKGGSLAADYLLERGHTRIAMLAGFPAPGGVHAERITGFRDALKKAGADDDPSRIIDVTVGFDAGRLAAEKVVSLFRSGGAVFAAADVLAIGLIKGLKEKGFRVPEDYSVIGFDDLDISRWITPGLTTVGQDIIGKGAIAVRLVAERIEGAPAGRQRLVLPVHMVERESVRDLRIP
jgi:LacI family transcriptional regulator